MSADRRCLALASALVLAFWLRHVAPPVDIAAYAMGAAHSRVIA